MRPLAAVPGRLTRPRERHAVATRSCPRGVLSKCWLCHSSWRTEFFAWGEYSSRQQRREVGERGGESREGVQSQIFRKEVRESISPCSLTAAHLLHRVPPASFWMAALNTGGTLKSCCGVMGVGSCLERRENVHRTRNLARLFNYTNTNGCQRGQTHEGVAETIPNFSAAGALQLPLSRRRGRMFCGRMFCTIG